MSSCITPVASRQATPLSAHARRLARPSLAFAGSLVALACSGASPEDAASRSAAIGTGVALSAFSAPGQIANGNGGCLDLPSGDTTNGTLLHIWKCNTDGIHQTWFTDGFGSIHYGGNPRKCVDFPAQRIINGVPANETQLQLWDCDAIGPDQRWTFSTNFLNQIQFTADTAKCIELRNGDSTNDTPVQVYDCNGTSGQAWTLLQGGPVEAFQLRNGNGACLDLPGGVTANGTRLQLWACDANGDNQSWYLDGRGALHFALQPSKCVDFPAQDWTSTGFVPQTQLQIWDCNPSGGDQSVNMPLANTLTMSVPNSALAVGFVTNPCIEARGGSAANGTSVQAYGCNGTTGQTWFPQSPTCAASAQGCGYEQLTTTYTTTAYGNGNIVAWITFSADTTGNLTLKPIVSNWSTNSSHDFWLTCNINQYSATVSGHLGQASNNVVSTTAFTVRPAPVVVSYSSMLANWGSVRDAWTPTMQSLSSFTCKMTAN